MAADPNPDPVFVAPKGDGAIVARDANGPDPVIATQSFHVQARMRLIVAESLECFPSCDFCTGRQAGVELPEAFGSTRRHDRRLNSSSVVSGKRAGSSLTAASTSSTNRDSAGRGRSSRKIRYHAASPSNSGKSFGRSRIKRSRSGAGSARIAASICSTVDIQLGSVRSRSSFFAVSQST
jgi:hypothetical protein